MSASRNGKGLPANYMYFQWGKNVFYCLLAFSIKGVTELCLFLLIIPFWCENDTLNVMILLNKFGLHLAGFLTKMSNIVGIRIIAS